MKSTFLSRLQSNARYALVGALVLVIGVPLYQAFILVPAGYGNALTTIAQSLSWIHAHALLFLGYRVLLIAGFALMLGLPFTLFRIIVAQEILGRDDDTDEQAEDDDEEQREQEEAGGTQSGSARQEGEAAGAGDARDTADAAGGTPDEIWRGRGFAVLAAWLGVVGLALLPLMTLASTLYLLISSSSSSAPLAGLFAVLTFTAGGGLLALSLLFFGAVITRRGRRLWPDSWLAFGYVAIAIALLLSASAVEVALDPTSGQSILSTPAILLFALWVLWFGIMVVRLKPE